MDGVTSGSDGMQGGGGHHRYPDVDRSPSDYSPASPTSPFRSPTR